MAFEIILCLITISALHSNGPSVSDFIECPMTVTCHPACRLRLAILSHSIFQTSWLEYVHSRCLCRCHDVRHPISCPSSRQASTFHTATLQAANSEYSTSIRTLDYFLHLYSTNTKSYYPPFSSSSYIPKHTNTVQTVLILIIYSLHTWTKNTPLYCTPGRRTEHSQGVDISKKRGNMTSLTPTRLG
jgi:hypothetical protein